VLLHQESLDGAQERLGLALQNPDFFELVKAIGGPIAFVSPGYSVYDDGSMCPIRQVQNMYRSLYEAAKANRAGLPSIPLLSWNSGRAEDLDFLAEWLLRQGPKVPVVAVNAQTGTNTDALAIALGTGMAQLERMIHRRYKWLVFGGRRKVEVIAQFIKRRQIVQVSRPKDFFLSSEHQPKHGQARLSERNPTVHVRTDTPPTEPLDIRSITGDLPIRAAARAALQGQSSDSLFP
jgi:hypothetical protein